MKHQQKNNKANHLGENCEVYPHIEEKELIFQLKLAVEEFFNASAEEAEGGLYLRFRGGQNFKLSLKSA